MRRAFYFLSIYSLLFSLTTHLEKIPDCCKGFLTESTQLNKNRLASKLYTEAMVLEFNHKDEEALKKAECSSFLYNGQKKWNIDVFSVLNLLRRF